MCDSECHLLFYIVAASGKSYDARAIRKTCLLQWIEDLLPGAFVSCDHAQLIMEHLIGPYSGPEHFLEKNGPFNFFMSQQHSHIEMCSDSY